MVQGLDALKRRFEAIPHKIIDDLKPVMERYADRIVGHMRNLVPEKEGKLKRSIGWTWGAAPAGSLKIGNVGGRAFGKLSITIYAGDDSTIVANSRGVEFQNALIQEFGTSNSPASPYFYPSWRLERRAAKGAMTRSIRKSIKNS